jgi:hypothetical protein
MIDTSRAGLRCRAKRTIRSHAAMIEAANEGTIIHESENLGRRLVLVQWNSGLSLYVFPDEIEIIGTRDAG